MDIADDQRRLYGDLFARYGDDARALSHGNQESQYERFQMLTRVFGREKARFSVHEIGCALGHFGVFLQEHCPSAVFSGSDIIEHFVETCKTRFSSDNFYLRDITEKLPDERYDFIVTCGLFHIPGNVPRPQFQAFIYTMLKAMYAMASKGIAATFLTSYYDPGYERPELFYQDEKQLMDFTVRELSRHFEFDEFGPLYEYALRVYRPEYIRTLYPQEAFAKYFKNK